MIVSCGEALVDVLPGKGEVPGGGPMNAAIAAARLGAPTAFVGRVSTDDAGDRIWAHLESSGVDLRAAQRGGEPTARAIVETHPVQRFAFLGDGTADASMTSVDLSALGPGPHIVHGGTLGIFRGSTAEVLAGMVEGVAGGHDGSIVSFDPNVRPAIIEQIGSATWWRFAERWLAVADLVRGSDEDFGWMGVTPADLLERGASAVIETRGADGAAVHRPNGELITVPASPIDFVDAVGAGDSFCGAALVMIHDHGWPDTANAWRRTLEFAVRVAGITCSRQGADPPTRGELSRSNDV